MLVGVVYIFVVIMTCFSQEYLFIYNNIYIYMYTCYIINFVYILTVTVWISVYKGSPH